METFDLNVCKYLISILSCLKSIWLQLEPILIGLKCCPLSNYISLNEFSSYKENSKQNIDIKTGELVEFYCIFPISPEYVIV